MFCWAFNRASTKAGSASVRASLISSRATSKAGRKASVKLFGVILDGGVPFPADPVEDFGDAFGDLFVHLARAAAEGGKELLFAAPSAWIVIMAVSFLSYKQR